MKQRTTVWLVGNMPHTLHKVLFHGQEITENSFFPVGTLSEEAQECRNKDYLLINSIGSDVQENVVYKSQTRTSCTE